jgi:hypothetical protein
MREHLECIAQLCICSQNVNCNYMYMDSLLSDLYENYDLLFLQESPWWYIRAAPSSSSRDGTDVIGGPLNPNWGCLVRLSGLDSLIPNSNVQNIASCYGTGHHMPSHYGLLF